MAAGSKGISAVVGTGRHRLEGSGETGNGDNNNIVVGIGGGGGCGIEKGLGRRGGISGRKRVEQSGMEWGGKVIHLDRQWSGNTAGGRKRSSKNLNIKRDRV